MQQANQNQVIIPSYDKLKILKSNKTEKAFNFSVQAHHDQFRKISGEPYIVHPIAVAEHIATYDVSEDHICTALLHDVLEDTQVSPGEIEKEFGTVVLQMISSLTGRSIVDMTKKEKQETWDERKKEYLKHLEQDKIDYKTLLICCADKIHNLTTLTQDLQAHEPSIWQELNAPAEKQLWYYQQILAILKKRLNHPIVDELTMLVEIFESLINKQA